MTLGEKVLQIQSSAPAIPRLGVRAYDWWNKALHGVVEGPPPLTACCRRQPPVVPS